MGVVAARSQWPEEVTDYVLRGAGRFIRISGRDVGDALRMTDHTIYPGLEQQKLLIRHPCEAGLEGEFQVESEFADSELFNLHSAGTNVKGGGQDRCPRMWDASPLYNRRAA